MVFKVCACVVGKCLHVQETRFQQIFSLDTFQALKETVANHRILSSAEKACCFVFFLNCCGFKVIFLPLEHKYAFLVTKQQMNFGAQLGNVS